MNALAATSWSLLITCLVLLPGVHEPTFTAGSPQGIHCDQDWTTGTLGLALSPLLQAEEDHGGESLDLATLAERGIGVVLPTSADLSANNGATQDRFSLQKLHTRLQI